MATNKGGKAAAATPEVAQTLVRATERGYDNVTVREPGEEFYLPTSVVEASKGKDNVWFEVVPEV